MVSAMLIFGSLVILFPSINSNKGIRDPAGGGHEFSDSFHQVLDCGFGSSLHQEDQHAYCLGDECEEFRQRNWTYNCLNFPRFAWLFYSNGSFSSGIKLSMKTENSARMITIWSHLTSLASHSRKEKLWGLIEMDEASLLTTSIWTLKWTWSDDIGCKGALVGNEETFRGNYRKQGRSFPSAAKAVFRIGIPVRSNITYFVSVDEDENHTTYITGFSISVFEAAVKRLPYKLTYKLIPFYGSSDELIKKVANEVRNLGFKRRNIRIIASIDDYAKALSSGNIKAAFLLTPYAKVFLAKHCADFNEIKPTYNHNDNLGGFGFVFPKGSPLASDISEALLELEESGELQLMEEEMPSILDCSQKLLEDRGSIGPSQFYGLFVFCGGTATIALLITFINLLYRHREESIQRMLIGIQLWLWPGRLQRMLVGRELWQRQLRRQNVLQLATNIFNDTNRRNELQLSRMSATSQA
ncbi:hypothetical protein DITRI_Ditri16bG0034400 [Diplodiscus trichospermus]